MLKEVSGNMHFKDCMLFDLKIGIFMNSTAYLEFENQTSKVVLTWYHESNGCKPVHFGYIKYKSAGNDFYAIFAANKRYMFTLFRDKQLWKVMSHTNLHSWNFDLDYFQEVPFILEAYQL